MESLFWIVLSVIVITWGVGFYFVCKLEPSLQTIIDSLRGGSERMKIALEKDKKRLKISLWAMLISVIVLFSYAGYAVYLKFHEPPQPPSCEAGINC